MDEYLVPSYSRIEPPIPPRYPPSHSYDVAAFTGIQGYSSVCIINNYRNYILNSVMVK